MNKIILNTVEIKEIKTDKSIVIDIKKFNITNFNLLIGDNAQGKTRLFNILFYVSNLVKGKYRKVNTDFKASFTFKIKYEKKYESIKYDLDFFTKNSDMVFFEKISRNNNLIFSTKDKFLFNETKNKKVQDFFLPANSPALNSIKDTEFITFKIIRDFFLRVVFINSTKSRKMNLDENSINLSENGENIHTVLFDWQKNYPQRFNLVIHELKSIFKFIKEFNFMEKNFFKSQKVKIPQILEPGVSYPVEMTGWSDGLYRVILILMSVQAPFLIDNEIRNPSLVLIDEIENGLDFKALIEVISYLQDFSKETQIIISSHSPLVCDYVHPKSWRIIKRKGSEISIKAPEEIEKNLNDQLDLFKYKHWDFYKEHISNSKDYK